MRLIRAVLLAVLAGALPAQAQDGGPGGLGGGFGGGPGPGRNLGFGAPSGGMPRLEIPGATTPPPLSLPPIQSQPDGGVGALPQIQLPSPLPQIELPGITGYAAPSIGVPLAMPGAGSLTLSARLTGEGSEIERGMVWRVFRPEPGPDGRLPLIATAQGGTSNFQLDPGSYLVHATFGRAGATKRITLGPNARDEQFVLDAGGLKLDAVLSGGAGIPPDKLRFSIYEGAGDAAGERALIVPNVSPKAVVRLNSGTYHVVSTYGNVNAVIRSDIRVEAGQLTEATVEHKAAEITMKLVREAGGEAIADTSWAVLTDSGDIVRESVGAFASMVLAEGEYVAVARNRERLYQREFRVVAGRNSDVEVIADENGGERIDASGD
ncbi:hypothetical protein [Aliihoeflea sp. 2WW]|jgi:hypothetical protein|uniref:hypothetical protein n=1 Tax=Aliihoeflea sp. 2WW TaxID=1381123 RepID=UPI0004660484|nr:hypothetical protein [Aliihoeflea sp. 2WW]